MEAESIMANKIRVGQPRHPYIIEVNDQGETIVFDLTDSSIGVRLLDMLFQIQRIEQKYTKKAKALGNQPNTHMPGLPFTKAQALLTRMTEDFYRDARRAADTFFGQGACQKVFGNQNYPDMFMDLLKALLPHFEKMGLETDKLKKDLAAKYLPDAAEGAVLK
jgi:hypothetical protein